MADPALEPAHERSLRRLIRQLQRDPRGALVMVSCADFDLRAVLEGQIATALGQNQPITVLDWSRSPRSPWDEVLAAHRSGGEGSIVSIHYDAIKPSVIDVEDSADAGPLSDAHAETLLRLNIGRDIRVQEQIAVLLWLAGPEPLETVRHHAPDLWAHRTLVLDFPSAQDLQMGWEDRLQRDWHDHEQKAQDHLKAADRAWLGPEGSLKELANAAGSLKTIWQIDQLVDVMDRLRRTYEEHAELHKLEFPTLTVVQQELMLAEFREDWDVLSANITVAKAAMPESGWPALAAVVCAAEAALAHYRGDFSEKFASLQRRVEHHERLAGIQIYYDWTSIDRAFLHAYLRDPVRARIAVDTARRGLSSVTEAWNRALALAAINEVRTRCALMLGQTGHALQFAWSALRRFGALREWGSLLIFFSIMREFLLELGLPQQARTALLEELDQLFERDRSPIRPILERELTLLAAAVGDTEQMLERARSYLDINQRLSHLHPVGALLQCSTLAREVYPWWSDETEFTRWPRQLDEHLESETREDARDRLRLERARWHLLTKEPDQAIALATATLPLRRASRGPSFVADACMVIARAHRLRGELAEAHEYLNEAHAALQSTPEEARPFDTWREVMLERSAVATAQGDRHRAWQAIDDALAFADQRRLKVERMRLLLEQARLETDTARGREAADHSLEIASELGYLRDEGCIRLERAKQAQHLGDLPLARSELSEACWLLARLGPPDRRDEAEALASALEET